MFRKKQFWRLTLSSIFLIVIACGATFYTHPTWVLDRVQTVRLHLAGIESHVVVVDGHRIHYNICGPSDGQPVVLLHGLGGRAEDWINMTPYLRKAGYRVYTPDLLGFGQSEEPRNATYSIADQAEMVVGFLDAVGLESVDLGGWSMGGWIAQKVAVDHPERIRRLVLMDSAGLNMPPRWDTHLFTPTTPEQLNQLHALLTTDPKPVPEFVAQDMLRISADYGWVVKKALASMFTARDVMDADLPSLQMPVLILWGDQDRITPLSEGQAMHALIPQSLLHVAEGCGHVAPQACTDQLGPVLANFLNSTYPYPDSHTMATARAALIATHRLKRAAIDTGE